MLTQNILAVMAGFRLSCENSSVSLRNKNKTVQRVSIGSVHLSTVQSHTSYTGKFMADYSVSFCAVARKVNAVSDLQLPGTDLNYWTGNHVLANTCGHFIM
jgi:hypothetical protein